VNIFWSTIPLVLNAPSGDDGMDTPVWHSIVRARFPQWPDKGWRASWRSKPPPACVGERLRGVVIAVAAFGAWIDAGIGAPVLLHIAQAPGFGRGTGLVYPRVDSEVTCWVYAAGPEGQVGATIRFEPEFLL
jgi:hypothetical protein